MAGSSSCFYLTVVLVFLSPARSYQKMSKAMMNFYREEEKEVGEEDRTATDLTTLELLTVEQLKELLPPPFPLLRGSCRSGEEEPGCGQEPSFKCVGGGEEWGVVLLDHMPAHRRPLEARRLLKRSQAVLVQDSDLTDQLSLPPDFHSSDGTPWFGRRSFTDVSDPSGVMLGWLQTEKSVSTTLVQGDLDRGGKVFDTIVHLFKTRFDMLNGAYRYYNRENEAYGTHLRLLLPAALLTSGNVLELGTNEFSTSLLPGILGKEGRRLVSVDSNRGWMERFPPSPWHEVVLVPPMAPPTSSDGVAWVVNGWKRTDRKEDTSKSGLS